MWFFDERYAAEPGSVGRARHELGAYAHDVGVGGDDLVAVSLAVSEAMTNAVLHGYRGAPGAVRVAAVVLDDALTVAVSDGGVGVHVPSERPGLGRGLQIISELVDRMSVRALATGGTEVRMRFDLPPAQGAVALPAAA